MELRNYDDNNNSDKHNCQHNCTLAVTHSQGQRSAKTQLFGERSPRNMGLKHFVADLCICLQVFQELHQQCTGEADVRRPELAEGHQRSRHVLDQTLLLTQVNVPAHQDVHSVLKNKKHPACQQQPQCNGKETATRTSSRPNSPHQTIQASCPCDLVQLTGC